MKYTHKKEKEKFYNTEKKLEQKQKALQEKAKSTKLPAEIREKIVSYINDNPENELSDSLKRLVPPDTPARNTRSKSKNNQHN